MSGYDVQVIAVDHCLIDVRADTAGSGVLAHVLSLQLPGSTGACVSTDSRRLLQLSPNRWILSSEQLPDEALVDQLNTRFRDLHAVATLVTDQYAGFIVTGTDAISVLAQGISMDISPQRFAVGQCAACSFARTKVILVALDAGRQYLLYVESSLAGYVADWFSRSIDGNSHA